MTPLALVTGGQQGIGLGIAKALSDAGFRIALASLPGSDSPQVVAALQQLGPSARYFRHDLAQVEVAAGLIDRIEAEMGPVSTLVQNAGVAARVRGDMLEIPPENFDFVTGINLRGAFFLAQAV
ncbi:MAG: SDR family NAD(P)-dependent oxidoreductase, partial [Hoeflea sp.]|nr:SDR family NAD(P)-dependent oxidoreductase [Hoeflea sp.]